MADEQIIPINIRANRRENEAVQMLASKLKASKSDVVRWCLPTPEIAAFFLNNKQLRPALSFRHVVTNGIRTYLQRTYEESTDAHFTRLRIPEEQRSAKGLQEGIARCLNEMQEHPEFPVAPWQVEQAEENVIFLGILYDAWLAAQAKEEPYSLLPVQTGMVGEDGKEHLDRPYWTVHWNGKPFYDPEQEQLQD